MPIEVRCPKCSTLLRVADEHAGRAASCPQCGNVFDVVVVQATPSTPSTPSVAPVTPAPSNQLPDVQGPPVSSGFDAEQNPFAAPQPVGQQPPFYYGQPDSWRVLDRGGLVLSFGIMGLLGSISMFCCTPLILFGFFAPAAWLMGRSDLKLMDEGVMNPGGRGTTQTGMTLGIIGTVFLGIAVFMFFAWIALAAAGNL